MQFSVMLYLEMELNQLFHKNNIVCTNDSYYVGVLNSLPVLLGFPSFEYNCNKNMKKLFKCIHLKGKLTEFSFHVKETNITQSQLYLNIFLWYTSPLSSRPLPIKKKYRQTIGLTAKKCMTVASHSLNVSCTTYVWYVIKWFLIWLLSVFLMIY